MKTIRKLEMCSLQLEACAPSSQLRKLEQLEETASRIEVSAFCLTCTLCFEVNGYMPRYGYKGREPIRHHFLSYFSLEDHQGGQQDCSRGGSV